VFQAGSLVDADRLRFDFSHFKSLSKAEIDQVETIVNQKIKEDIPVMIHFKPIEEAKAMGAMALFGEKYEDIVRVVQIEGFSMELCGGTHLLKTGDMEAFKIISESAISAGTRRIEAIAGKEAIQAYNDHEKKKVLRRLHTKLSQWKALAQELSLSETEKNLDEKGAKVETLSLTELIQLEEEVVKGLKILEKKREAFQKEHVGHELSHVVEQAERIENSPYSLISQTVENASLPVLRSFSDKLIHSQNNLIVILASEKDKKGFFLVRLSKEAVNGNLSALQLMQVLTRVAGGSGGGRSEMAQAGSVNPEKFQEAFKEVKAFLQHQAAIAR